MSEHDLSTESASPTQIIAVEDQYSSGLYAKHEIVLERGSGAILWDTDGRAYLDCASGHGVANLGHAHPVVADAIARQAKRLITLPETYYNQQRATLMQKLVQLVPGMERVFLCNSGAESIEAAIKLARLSTGRSQIIAAMRGFHGRTFGALSATWNKKYRQAFEPLTPGFQHIPYNNSGALAQAISDETAAVLLEVVQGEGGVYLADPEFIQTAQDLCRAHGALLIIDEVQTGFGRTGRMFAIEHHAIQPDMLCLAKSIAGGLPMGAMLFSSAVKNIQPGLHASTFGGNPLACAAALAVLEVFRKREVTATSRRKRRVFAARTFEFTISTHSRNQRAGVNGRGRNQEKGDASSTNAGRARHPGFTSRIGSHPLAAALSHQL